MQDGRTILQLGADNAPQLHAGGCELLARRSGRIQHYFKDTISVTKMNYHYNLLFDIRQRKRNSLMLNTFQTNIIMAATSDISIIKTSKTDITEKTN